MVGRALCACAVAFLVCGCEPDPIEGGNPESDSSGPAQPDDVGHDAVDSSESIPHDAIDAPDVRDATTDDAAETDQSTEAAVDADPEADADARPEVERDATADTTADDDSGDGDAHDGLDAVDTASDAVDSDAAGDAPTDSCPTDKPLVCGGICVPALTITSISSPTICASGARPTLTISGSGFHGTMTATVGGVLATDVAVLGPNSLTLRPPSIAASTVPYSVRVAIAEGCSATLASAVSSLGVPRVDSIDAKRGWNGIENAVEIRGEGLVAATSFALKGAGAAGGPLPLKDLVAVTEQFAKATVPTTAVAGGSYELIATPPNGCVASLPLAYTVDGAPAISITSLAPQFGWSSSSTSVSISGSGMVSTPRAYLLVPAMTPTLQPLGATSFGSSASATTVVPPGILDGGPYDLVMMNPDGSSGKLSAAFRVVSKAAPSVADATPSAGLSATATSVSISGCNFRSSTLALVDSAGTSTPQTTTGLSCAGSPTCPGGTKTCVLTGTITPPKIGSFIVRVTNPDEGTYGNFASFTSTSATSSLEGGFATGPSLLMGRRSLAAVSSRVSGVGKFVYAIAGERADSAVSGSVEVSALDAFGAPTNWFMQRTALNAARAGHAAVERNGYIYVLGGTSSTGGTGGASPTGVGLDTIERAKVLDLSDQPKLGPTSATTTGTLGKGTWYYAVAAVKDPAVDTDNPGGESLASDESVVALATPGSVTLSWSAVSGASGYRVYRSQFVNGSSQSEVFLSETTALTFTDDGSRSVDTLRIPQRRGSTGVWITLGAKLARKRFNLGATLAPDIGGQWRAYVIGGHGSCFGFPDATMNCWEMATLTADGKTLGTPVFGTSTMSVSRERLGVASLNSTNGPPTWSGGEAYVFASGGLGPTASSASIEYAYVDASGVLMWSGSPSSDYSPRNKDGSQLSVVNGSTFAFGGGSVGAYSSNVKRAGPAALNPTSVIYSTWSDSASPMALAIGRFGLASEGAGFYVIGGTTNDSDALTNVSWAVH